MNKDNTQEISIDKSEGSECVPSLTIESPPPCMCSNRCPAMENTEEQVTVQTTYQLAIVQ